MSMQSWRDDPALATWLREIERRSEGFLRTCRLICATEGSLHNFCFRNGLDHFGLVPCRGGIWYREWAPAAEAASLVGDFNGWDMQRHPCVKDDSGVFFVFVPDRSDGSNALQAGSRYKVALLQSGQWVHRVPAWARATVQDLITGDFCAVVPEPVEDFAWVHPRPPPPPSLRLYEVHVGMASDEPAIASWSHFRERVLPHVVAMGYTALLLMAVHEHGYYASFGYQVSAGAWGGGGGGSQGGGCR